MKSWKIIWIGAASTWLLLAGFFFSLGAMQGMLQKSVLGFDVYYDTATIVQVWRYETRDIMRYAMVPGRKRGTMLPVPKESVEQIDQAKSIDDIMAAQQAWLTQYPKAFYLSNNYRIKADEKFAEMKVNYEHHVDQIPTVWQLSLALLLLPPVALYLLIWGIALLVERKMAEDAA